MAIACPANGPSCASPVAPGLPASELIASTSTLWRIVWECGTALPTPFAEVRVSTTSTRSFGLTKPPEAASALTATDTPRMPPSSVLDRKPPRPLTSFSLRIGSPGRKPTRATRPDMSVIASGVAAAVMKSGRSACSGHACPGQRCRRKALADRDLLAGDQDLVVAAGAAVAAAAGASVRPTWLAMIGGDAAGDHGEAEDEDARPLEAALQPVAGASVASRQPSSRHCRADCPTPGARPAGARPACARPRETRSPVRRGPPRPAVCGDACAVRFRRKLPLPAGWTTGHSLMVHPVRIRPKSADLPTLRRKAYCPVQNSLTP